MTATGTARSGSLSSWLVRAGFYIGVIAAAVVMSTDIPDEAKAGLAAIMMVLLLFMNVPIAAALGLPGAYALWMMRGFSVVEGSFRRIPYDIVATWSYTVLPMFIFMGLLLWRSGITTRIYNAAKSWLSWLPGGLAVGTNFAGAGFASVNGSTVASVYAIGRIGVPEMVKEKYDPRMSTGAVLVAGMSGQLIPPSIYMVIYAGLVSVPVGPQLLAGIVPGITLLFMYSVIIIALSAAIPRLVGRFKGSAGSSNDEPLAPPVKTQWQQRWSSLGGVWPVPVLIIVMMGGLYNGFFTATEAGAAGALGAVVLACVYLKGKTLVSALGRALTDTVATTAGIFFLFIGAMIFNRALVVSGIAELISSWITDLGLHPVQFLLVLIIMYMVLGMFLDPLTMMLVTIPVLMPTLASMEISLVFFGVFVVILAELAVVTPPIGMLSFILYKITQHPDVNRGTKITLGDVFTGALWFLPAPLLLLVTLVFYPDLATWLPDMMQTD